MMSISSPRWGSVYLALEPVVYFVAIQVLRLRRWRKLVIGVSS
jgi:hypothetical protein